MLKLIKSTALLRTCIILALLFPTIPAFASQDAIIAIVNDEIITLKDLKDYMGSIYVQLKMEGRSKNEIREILTQLEKNGIQQLIQDKLILTKANEKGLEIKEEIIDQKIAQIRSNYSSEEKFIEALLADGATVTDLRNKIREQLKVKYIIELDIKSKIFINPQEVTNYYEKNPKQFEKPERVDLDSIYISNNSMPAVAKERVDQAYKLLTEGNDFDEVAKEYSQTASIGIVEKGQMLPVIESAIFKLKPGEISSIVDVNGGFYIFKLKEKFPRKIAELEEVKDGISEILFQQKLQKRFDKWVNKLEEEAFIELKDIK